MNGLNQQMINDLLRAGRAIRWLNTCNVVVHTVVAGERHPKLLTGTPAAAELLDNAKITRRVMMHDKHICTFSVQVFGCIVEWIEVRPVVTVLQGAGHA